MANAGIPSGPRDALASPRDALAGLPRLGPLVFLPGPNRAPYPRCNGLYVEADCRVLIDQGGSIGQAQRVAASAGIDRIYITHWHEDHALAAGHLPQVDLFVPEADRSAVESRSEMLARCGMAGEAATEMERLLDEMQFHHRPVQGCVRPGEIIDLGGVVMEALHMPGHTAGHTCYWFPRERMVVLGDYDLTRAGPVLADVDSSVGETYASLARLAALPVERAVSAHGRGWFDGEEFRERLKSYVKVLDDRLEAIVEEVSRGHATTRELLANAPRLWTLPMVPGYEQWVAMAGHVMLAPCMRYLVEQGRLRETAPGRYTREGLINWQKAV
jgi:glyoxylase-like metal-dependent hydrolase (beta-lactamase superfamily II)